MSYRCDWEQVCQSEDKKTVGQHGGCDSFILLLMTLVHVKTMMMGGDLVASSCLWKEWREPSMISHLPLCADHHVFLPFFVFFFFLFLFPGGPRSPSEPFEVSSPDDAAPAACEMLWGLGASSFMPPRLLNELSLFCYFFCIFASFAV